MVTRTGYWVATCPRPGEGEKQVVIGLTPAGRWACCCSHGQSLAFPEQFCPYEKKCAAGKHWIPQEDGEEK